MKTLTFSLTCLVLLALGAGPVGAATTSLRADLNNNGDLELVVRVPMKHLYTTTDTNKDGETDIIETRGEPIGLCNLDQDSALEAIVQDGRLNQPWTAGGMDGSPQPALVFVRGQVLGCQSSGLDSNTTVLLVHDADYSGTADIDGDGTMDIVWQ